jgi:cation:H+ antiporter
MSREKASFRIRVFDKGIRICYNKSVNQKMEVMKTEIMELWIAIPLLIVGFVCLVKGADWFVDGAAGIAAKLRVPTLIIGLTIVSFGTSAPELATSLISAMQGSGDIAIGNVLGSNITNILLILGLAAIICPLIVQKSALTVDFPVLLGTSVLVLLLGGIDG